jgi:2-oxoglutarate decarboxylase
MYQRIEAKRSVRKLYTETLVRRGDITLEEAESALDDFNNTLQGVLDAVRGEPSLAPTSLPVVDLGGDTGITVEDTAVPGDLLRALVSVVRTVPDGFTIHPKLERQFAQRDEMVAAGEVDWALAEALAMGSLLHQGVNVRLTGQDTRRGTFSQRHAVLVDYSNADEFIPLAHLDEGLARVGAADLVPSTERLGGFTVRDSLLSEYAAVGFEYGYSVEAPEALVAWEAQFGDFSNGAQIIIDNFLAAAEIKWGQFAGLVMLLPHGYEGQGPEHSSSRFERFLGLCARGNMRVTVPSTSSQYFHLLRSQALRTPKRPLIVVTPKSLLRAQASRSKMEDLENGSFAPVLDDSEVAEASAVRRIVLCSGKVAHDAFHHRRELAGTDEAGAAAVAIVRLEEIYPWPSLLLAGILERYNKAEELVWLQEEPENMGAWSFVHGRLHASLPPTVKLRHVSRTESASPAIGSAALHQLEQTDLLRRAVG